MTYIHIEIIAKEMFIYAFNYNNIQNQEFHKFTMLLILKYKQCILVSIIMLLKVCNLIFIKGSSCHPSHVTSFKFHTWHDVAAFVNTYSHLWITPA